MTTTAAAGVEVGTSAARGSVTGTCPCLVGGSGAGRTGSGDGVAAHQPSVRNWSQLRVAMAMIAACGLTPGASGMSEASLTRRLR